MHEARQSSKFDEEDLDAKVDSSSPGLDCDSNSYSHDWMRILIMLLSPTLTFGRACSCGCKADCICRVPLYIHEKHCPTLPIRISWESVIPFLFKSILIIFKFFHLGKGMGFFKIQAKNFALPFLQLSQLGKGEQKLKYSKYFHVCDMAVKVEPLSKIKRKVDTKGSFISRCDVKLIHADKRGRKEREQTLCSDDAS